MDYEPGVQQSRRPTFNEGLLSIRDKVLLKKEGKSASLFHELAFNMLENFGRAKAASEDFDRPEFKPRGIEVVHVDPETKEVNEVGLDVKDLLRITVDREGNLRVGASLGDRSPFLFIDAEVFLVTVSPDGRVEPKVKEGGKGLGEEKIKKRMIDILLATKEYYRRHNENVPDLYTAFKKDPGLQSFILNQLPKFPADRIRAIRAGEEAESTDA